MLPPCWRSSAFRLGTVLVAGSTHAGEEDLLAAIFCG